MTFSNDGRGTQRAVKSVIPEKRTKAQMLTSVAMRSDFEYWGIEF